MSKDVHLLKEAIKEQDVDSILSLIKAYPDLAKYRDDEGNNLLHMHANLIKSKISEKSFIEYLPHFVKLGVDINARNYKKQSVIEIAERHNSVKSAWEIIIHDLNVENTDFSFSGSLERFDEMVAMAKVIDAFYNGSNYLYYRPYYNDDFVHLLPRLGNMFAKSGIPKRLVHGDFSILNKFYNNTDNKIELRNYTKKYIACEQIRQLALGHKHESSPISKLPREINNKIQEHVAYDAGFNESFVKKLIINMNNLETSYAKRVRNRQNSNNSAKSI